MAHISSNGIIISTHTRVPQRCANNLGRGRIEKEFDLSNTTCSVDDMSHTPGRLYRGMCAKHYQRFRKSGDASSQPRTYAVKCATCDEAYESRSVASKFCSQRCKDQQKLLASGNTCVACNAPMWPSANFVQGVSACWDCRKSGLVPPKHGTVGSYNKGCRCEGCAGAKREANMAYKARVKAEHGVNPSTMFNRRYRERTGLRYRMGTKDWISAKLRLEIYERDDWLCHLCNEPVDRSAHFNDDFAPSLDHLKPRSKGGSDETSNLKTSHRICNATRRDDELDALEVV